MWSILFGLVVGTVVGAKYNAKILPYVAAGEAMIQTWIKGAKGSGPT